MTHFSSLPKVKQMWNIQFRTAAYRKSKESANNCLLQFFQKNVQHNWVSHSEQEINKNPGTSSPIRVMFGWVCKAHSNVIWEAARPISRTTAKKVAYSNTIHAQHKQKQKKMEKNKLNCSPVKRGNIRSRPTSMTSHRCCWAKNCRKQREISQRVFFFTPT